VEYLESNGLKIIKKFAIKPLDNKIKRRTKDDSEVLELRRGKMNNDISDVLEKIKSQKLAKDDSELIKTANKLKNININKLKGEKIYDCVENLKEFFKAATSELKDDSLISSIGNIIQILNELPKNVNLAKKM
jgi:hypothetical protein